MKQLRITISCEQFTASEIFISNHITKQIKWMKEQKNHFLKTSGTGKLTCNIEHLQTVQVTYSQNDIIYIDGLPFIIDIASNVFRKAKSKTVLEFSAVAEMAYHNLLQIEQPVINFVHSILNK